MDAPLIVVNGLAAASLVLAWGFFRRFQLNRPPLGAFNRTDVGNNGGNFAFGSPTVG